MISGTRLAACMLVLCLVSGQALAQQQTEEGRLRDALRRAVVDLRAAQDNQATLQAALAQAQQQRDQLQQQVTQLNAQLAAKAAAPAQPAQQAAEAQQMQDAVEALKKQNAALQQGLARWQAAYQKAATLARSEDVQGRAAAVAANAAQQTLSVCQSKNGKLIGVSEDILHLYRTPHFRSLVRGDWDAVLGFKRVELENIVQGQETRIENQKYYPGERPAPKPAPRPAAQGHGA